MAVAFRAWVLCSSPASPVTAYDNGVRRGVSGDADGDEFAFGGLPVDP